MKSRLVWNRTIGVLCWCAAISAGAWMFAARSPSNSTRLAQLLWISPRVVEATCSRDIPEMTPIYEHTGDQQWRMVGRVAGYRHFASEPSSATQNQIQIQIQNQDAYSISLDWYGDQAAEEYRFHIHTSDQSLAAVIRELLPEDRQRRFRQRIQDVYQRRGEEWIQSLQPIFERSLRESVPLVQTAFIESLARHRPELNALSERYQQEVLQEKLGPLLRDELMPIARRHAEPVARQIGKELWDQASLWRFGWRYLYDKAPLTERNLVREEWERFVDEDAIPIIESHSEELIEAQRLILADVMTSQPIREKLGDVGDYIWQDKELRGLVGTMLREALVDNAPLHEVWKRNWSSAEASATLDRLGEDIEPIVREFGDEVFGTKEAGITPEFARVLRTQILGKDRRWIIATRRTDGTRETEKGVKILPGDAEKAPIPLLIANGAKASSRFAGVGTEDLPMSHRVSENTE